MLVITINQPMGIWDNDDGGCASMDAWTHAAEPGQRTAAEDEAGWSSASSSARRDICVDIGVFLMMVMVIPT